MSDTTTILRPTDGPTVQETDRRMRQRLLVEYAEERLQRFGVRFILFSLGCSLGYLAVDLTFAILSFVILIAGDLQDCIALKYYVRPKALNGEYPKAQMVAVTTSAIQGLSMLLGVSTYYFALGAEANVLFVVGALGLGAVNAAIALPKNPVAAISRLSFYLIAPFLFMGTLAYQTRSWDPFFGVDTAGMMLLFCMLYMFIAFTKSGLRSFAITQDYERQQVEMREVSERAALHQTEMRQLSLVARNANDSMVITDRSRHIIWVNDAFTRITGFSFQEAQGALISDLLSGPNQELKSANTIDLAVHANQPFRGDIQNITKDGRRIWLDVNLFPVRDDTGRIEFFVSIERDVTEARALAQEMSKAKLAAEQGARAKAEFLANMSHEIRTPLTGVLGMADLLSETTLDDEQTRFVDTIRGSSLSLIAIINDILDLSKLDAGRMELHPVIFSPRACLQETYDLLAPTAKSKGLDTALIVDDNIPDFIKADDGRIRQVAMNILGNAIKFTSSGGVAIHLAYNDHETSPRLICEIVDTGIGISEEQQAHIFDHFTQAEASTTRKYGGTGLGLSITRHILDVMGGSISVTSKLGEGSTFRFEIPVEQAEEQVPVPAMDSQSASEAATSDLEGLRVLVAEDNKTNRFLLEKYFSEMPIDLAFAEDGVEAVEKAIQFEPDLIFMDMSMPRMSGVEATIKIRAMTGISQPVIVALTAHAFDEEKQACIDAGMDDFLTKPIRKSTLLEWMSQFKATYNYDGARPKMPHLEEGAA